ncbi:MAG: hypothetical protein ACOYMD_04890, partial [Paludibacter sp.]
MRKTVNYKLVLGLLSVFMLSFSGTVISQNVKKVIHTSEYRNFYGICWDENPHQNLVYARQMGYEYVFYQPGME